MFSFHSEECNLPLVCLQSPPPSPALPLEDMSPHAGVAITLSPDLNDPGLLTQKPPCFVPFSPWRMRAEGGERKDNRSVKNGSACLRSLPIRMLLKACLSIMHNHTEAGCSWGTAAWSRKSCMSSSSPTHTKLSLNPISTDTRILQHPPIKLLCDASPLVPRRENVRYLWFNKAQLLEQYFIHLPRSWKQKSTSYTVCRFSSLHYPLMIFKKSNVKWKRSRWTRTKCNGASSEWKGKSVALNYFFHFSTRHHQRTPVLLPWLPQLVSTDVFAEFYNMSFPPFGRIVC